eukprot:FR736185.1.p2 GENE.FR736185.1~~FR736185.1.p2  ORF type:complete len:101 (-),score=5.70 FR736185.1:336-638(-)
MPQGMSSWLYHSEGAEAGAAGGPPPPFPNEDGPGARMPLPSGLLFPVDLLEGAPSLRAVPSCTARHLPAKVSEHVLSLADDRAGVTQTNNMTRAFEVRLS